MQVLTFCIHLHLYWFISFLNLMTLCCSDIKALYALYSLALVDLLLGASKVGRLRIAW